MQLITCWFNGLKAYRVIFGSTWGQLPVNVGVRTLHGPTSPSATGPPRHGTLLRRPLLLPLRCHGLEELLQVRRRRRRKQRWELRRWPSAQGRTLFIWPCSTLNLVSEGPVPLFSFETEGLFTE